MNWKSVAIFAALVFIFSACAPKVDSPADIAAIKAISVDYGKAASAGKTPREGSNWFGLAVIPG
jgi:hypothetical protein